MTPQRVTGEAAQPASSGTKRCRRGAGPGAASPAVPGGAARRDGGRTELRAPRAPRRRHRPAGPRRGPVQSGGAGPGWDTGPLPRPRVPAARPPGEQRRCGGAERGRGRRAEGGGAPSPRPRPPPAAGGAKRGPAAPPAGRRRRGAARRRPRPLKGKDLLRWNGGPSAPRLGRPRSGPAPPRDTPLGTGVPRPLAKRPRAQPEAPRLRNERPESLEATRARPGSRTREVK